MSVPILYPLSEETVSELLRLSALGWSIKDIAMFFDFDLRLFKLEADNPHSEIAYNIKRGKLVLRANIDIKIATSAENGNITAIQQLAKLMKEKRYNDLLNSIGDD